jgi:hypothetical protein
MAYVIELYVLHHKRPDESFSDALRRLVRFVSGANESKLMRELRVKLWSYTMHLGVSWDDIKIITMNRPNFAKRGENDAQSMEIDEMFDEAIFPTGLIVNDEAHIASNETSRMGRLLKDNLKPGSAYRYLGVTATPGILLNDGASWSQEHFRVVILEGGVEYRGAHWMLEHGHVEQARDLAHPLWGGQFIRDMVIKRFQRWSADVGKINLIRLPSGVSESLFATELVKFNVQIYESAVTQRTMMLDVLTRAQESCVEEDMSSWWDSLGRLAVLDRYIQENPNKDTSRFPTKAHRIILDDWMTSTREERLTAILGWSPAMWMRLQDLRPHSTRHSDIVFTERVIEEVNRYRQWCNRHRAQCANFMNLDGTSSEQDAERFYSMTNSNRAPEEDQYILLKELLRYGHDFRKRHVGIMYGRPTDDMNSLPQELPGRWSHYVRVNEHSESNPLPLVYTNIPVLKEYCQWVDNLREEVTTRDGRFLNPFLGVQFKTSQLRVDKDTNQHRVRVNNRSLLAHPAGFDGAREYDSQMSKPKGQRNSMFRNVIRRAMNAGSAITIVRVEPRSQRRTQPMDIDPVERAVRTRQVSISNLSDRVVVSTAIDGVNSALDTGLDVVHVITPSYDMLIIPVSSHVDTNTSRLSNEEFKKIIRDTVKQVHGWERAKGYANPLDKDVLSQPNRFRDRRVLNSATRYQRAVLVEEMVSGKVKRHSSGAKGDHGRMSVAYDRSFSATKLCLVISRKRN